MPNIAFKRDELKKLEKQYEVIEDCVAGEKRVKARKQKYLPQPNPEDTSRENLARYDSYIERAVFYNVTQRTLLGLVGQIFSKDPVVEVPTQFDAIIKDANGGGLSMTQLAKRACTHGLSLGRGGIFVDYPTVEGGASKAELERGDVRPTVNIYHPGKVINWRTKQRGAKTILSLVVLEEQYEYSDDGFEIKYECQWRVLRLDEATDIYRVEVWRKGVSNLPGVTGVFRIAQGPFFPKDASGVNLKEIPFTFFGCENNDETPDLPPLYDLSSLNIAHYRNSADYEEASFIVGQPTLYIAGLTKDWVDNVLKGKVQLGSRAAIALPVGGEAGMVQVEPNTMPKEAMEAKERQMVALGAKLVEQKQVQRTATEANLEDATETSTLVSTAKNVSAAVQFALEWCAVFMGIAETKIKYELQTDFAIARMSPEDRKQLIAEWQGGAISFTEMRSVLRKIGVATEDDNKAKQEIADDLNTQNQQAADAAALLADATGQNDNTNNNGK